MSAGAGGETTRFAAPGASFSDHGAARGRKAGGLDGIRGAVALLVTIGIVVTLSGFFGHVHPAFDTIGAFRVQAGIAFAAVLLFSVAFSALTARLLAFTGILIAGAGLAPAVLPDEPVGSPDLVAYSHNMRFDNPIPEAVVGAIAAVDADIVALQEVREPNDRAISRLGRAYRTRVFCPFGPIGAVAVISKLEAIGEPGCARGQGVAWARLSTPRGPLTAVSLHLPWPWPYGQAPQAAKVAQILSELPEPIVILGDFNMAPWAYTLRQIHEATGTRTVRGLRLTYHRPAFWPGLPIDHVLVSEDLAAETETLGRYGSDHSALRTWLRFR